MSCLHNGIIVMSLPVEVPSSGETSSEERNITLLKPHENQKGFNISYRNYSNLKKVHVFRHAVVLLSFLVLQLSR